MTDAEIAEKTAVKRRTFTVEQRQSLEKWREDYKRVFAAAGLDMLRVAESENRYCSDSCCPHLPAATITTQIGDIAFWWRKRVTVIDWSASLVTKRASELFSSCPDTIGDCYVHCWNYEAAVERLKVVLASVQLQPAAEQAKES